MADFVVNIVKPGTITVHRIVHLPTCRYAGLARRHYVGDAIEVLRLLINKARGNDDRTKFCQYCEPLTEIDL